MSGWQQVAVGDLAENFDRFRAPIKSSDRVGGQTPYYGASGIIDWVDGHTHDGKFLLVAEDGENLRSRSTPIAFTTSGRVWVNNHAHVLKCPTDAETEFLGYAINLLDVTGYLTGSAQPKLSRRAMDSMILHVPPVVERIAIAEVLGALDDKIAANRDMAAHAVELFDAMFDRLGCDVDGGSTSLDQLVNLNPRTQKPGDDAVYVDMKGLPTGSLNVESWTTREPKGGARFRNGDTLLARITPCLENGKLGYVDFLEDDQSAVGSTEFIVMRPKNGTPEVWPFCLCRRARFRAFAIRRMVGSSGRQRLAAADLAGYELQQVDDAAMREFEETTRPIAQRLRAASNENESLAKTRDGMLPLLMSGKLRVRDAAKQVGEVV